MARVPPGGAYFGTDRPQNALPEEGPGPAGGLGAGLGGAPPIEPPMEDPSLPTDPAASPGDAPEIIAQMAEQYMGIPREQLDAMPPEQYLQLLDELERGYPQDAALLDAIASVRPLLSDSAMGAAPPAPPAPPLADAAPPMPAGEPSFRPDQPY